MSVFVVTTPTVPGENTIQPAADNVEGLTILPHSGTQAATLLEVGAVTPGFPHRVAYISAGLDTAKQGLIIDVPTNGSSGLVVNDSGLGLPLLEVDPSLNGTSVEAWSRDAGDNALVAKGAAGQAVPIFKVVSSANQAVLSVGLNTVGFYGASPVVKQAGASAAAIAAIVDPNAKAAISALQTALANLGLVTSPA